VRIALEEFPWAVYANPEEMEMAGAEDEKRLGALHNLPPHILRFASGCV